MKGYVARDKDGEVVFHLKEPVKRGQFWMCYWTDSLNISGISLPPDITPQWEDTDPIEVNVNITKASDDAVTISKDRYEQLLQYEQEYNQRQSMTNSFMQNK